MEDVTGILTALSGLTPPPPSFPLDFTLGDLELPPSSARRFSFSLVEDFDLGFRDRNISVKTKDCNFIVLSSEYSNFPGWEPIGGAGRKHKAFLLT